MRQCRCPERDRRRRPLRLRPPCRWYGLEQAFDETGLLVYAQAHHYQAKIVGFPCDPNPGQFPNLCGGDPSNLVTLPMRPWSGYVAGMRIRF
jgi:hypothetical protein